MPDRIRMTDMLERAPWEALDRWRDGAPARSVVIDWSEGHLALSLHQGADMFGRGESFGERTFAELVEDTIAEFTRTDGVWREQEQERRELDRASSVERAWSDGERAAESELEAGL